MRSLEQTSVHRLEFRFNALLAHVDSGTLQLQDQTHARFPLSAPRACDCDPMPLRWSGIRATPRWDWRGLASLRLT